MNKYPRNGCRKPGVRRSGGDPFARRPGYTLVEMLVVITAFSAIFAVTLLTLTGLRRTNAILGGRLEQTVQEQRFAEQLRLDAHQALSARNLSPDAGAESGPTLRLTLGDARTIEYHLRADSIERREQKGETQVHREVFFVPPVLANGWSLDDARPYPLVTVLLQGASAGDLHSPHDLPPLRVDAAVGISRAAQIETPADGSMP